MIERVEKIEDELNIVKYKFELLEQFFKSDTEKTESLKLLIDAMKNFMQDTDKKIKDLEDAFILQSKNRELMNKLIESQGKTIKTIIETLEIMNKK